MIQTEKKRALGRGLSALIPQPITTIDPPAKGLVRLPVEEIRRDASQPRRSFDDKRLEELAESIKNQGLIQPVLVRKDGKHYRLIAGERRWRAAQRAGLREIPAIVKEATDREAFEWALVENLQRADLNPLEEAMGYRRLMDEGSLSQEQVARRVGKERSTVANSLRLLALPDEVKAMLERGEVDMGHARAVLGLAKPVEMLALARAVVAESLSVRETERRVKQGRGPSGSLKRKKKEDHSGVQVRQLIEELQRKLGTKVRLVDRGGKGTIEVDFFSYEDLDRLLAQFRK